MHLETDGLGRRYGDDVRAVRDVLLDLGEGIYGLLGPNGAGKSTLMRLLTRVEDPTTEAISWDGTDIEYVAALRGVDGGTAADRVDELLALTNLEHVADRKLGSFSGGMRQRVGIPQAPVNDPDLLVVDEPTVGLDPEERVRFRNVISSSLSPSLYSSQRCPTTGSSRPGRPRHSAGASPPRSAGCSVAATTGPNRRRPSRIRTR